MRWGGGGGAGETAIGLALGLGDALAAEVATGAARCPAQATSSIIERTTTAPRRITHPIRKNGHCVRQRPQHSP